MVCIRSFFQRDVALQDHCGSLLLLVYLPLQRLLTFARASSIMLQVRAHLPVVRAAQSAAVACRCFASTAGTTPAKQASRNPSRDRGQAGISGSRTTAHGGGRGGGSAGGVGGGGGGSGGGAGGVGLGSRLVSRMGAATGASAGLRPRRRLPYGALIASGFAVALGVLVVGAPKMEDWAEQEDLRILQVGGVLPGKFVTMRPHAGSKDMRQVYRTVVLGPSASGSDDSVSGGHGAAASNNVDDETGPVVVVFNGNIGESSVDFADLQRRVAAFATSFAYDRGGCGFSERPRSVSYDAFSEELLALIDDPTLGLEVVPEPAATDGAAASASNSSSPPSSSSELLMPTSQEGRPRRRPRVVLVGQGYGALLNHEFLVRHPDRVAGVLALDPAVRGAKHAQLQVDDSVAVAVKQIRDQTHQLVRARTAVCRVPVVGVSLYNCVVLPASAWICLGRESVGSSRQGVCDGGRQCDRQQRAWDDKMAKWRADGVAFSSLLCCKRLDTPACAPVVDFSCSTIVFLIEVLRLRRCAGACVRSLLHDSSNPRAASSRRPSSRGLESPGNSCACGLTATAFVPSTTLTQSCCPSQMQRSAGTITASQSTASSHTGTPPRTSRRTMTPRLLIWPPVSTSCGAFQAR